MFDLYYIFVQIDDFINLFFKKDSYRLLYNPNRKRNRQCSMTISEIITIMIMFHFSGYKDFKSFFLSEVSKKDFPNLLSYSRFIQVSKSAFYYLYSSERNIQKAEQNGIYIIDSTKLEVCNFLRKSRNKTFKNVEATGKTINASCNFIDELAPGIFNGLNHLQELNLSSNQIRNLVPNLFHGLNNLQILNLFGNLIIRLPDGIFTGLGNLQDLRLSYNDILELQDGIFTDLGNLQSMTLHKNRISHLSSNVFNGLSRLNSLNLLDNRIEHLPSHIFRMMNPLRFDLKIGIFRCPSWFGR